MSHEATARAYYRAIDAADDDALADLLAPGFAHDRPDRTLSGRETFVRFMREERPRTDTEHRIDAVYVESADANAEPEVAVRGRLLGDDGGELFGFVDVFEFANGDDADATVDHLTTYTD
ncbi:nuclear transport factor 2 family protein [Halobaculum rubrum]|uniref:nuclear transport factor 2 family protein n=1 Tax=Halobaculum rubrum TaxID=2872158 RepID=UPI001CA3F04B|nr:nuclear transport factor 2 family protein [Halobaculum rubrum]QZX98246.1 nuclear transport factor 2 family protein [Halobaculum rubrum]